MPVNLLNRRDLLRPCTFGARTIVFLLSLVISREAFAYDIFSFIDSSCQVTSGLVIGMKDSTLQIIDLSGHYVALNQDTIKTIAITSTLQNPITGLFLDSNLKQSVREIYMGGSARPTFTGWPIRFIDDLTIFYDVTGKTHVIELSEVTAVTEAHDLPPRTGTLGQSVSIDVSELNSQCSKKSLVTSGAAKPTRIISDQINIGEFLETFERGYRNLENFEERTKFYAKPFLFERRARLGVLMLNKPVEANNEIPAYFQWSTGKPYGFQSLNVFGGAPVEWTPLAEPISVFRSDLKSHFFSATFVGSLTSLPAGTPHYATNRSAVPDKVFGGEHINYIGIMGLDYGPFSVGLGTHFPVFVFNVYQRPWDDWSPSEFREVLAKSISPIYRVIFHKGRVRLRAVFSPSQQDGQGTDDKSLRVENNTNTRPTSFNLSSYFMRAGIDFQFNDDVSASLDGIFTETHYRESWTTSAYNFDWTRKTIAFSISHTFGYYIAARGFLNFVNSSYDYNFPVRADKTSQTQMSAGGALEFIF